jgi:hypothetical protein
VQSVMQLWGSIPSFISFQSPSMRMLECTSEKVIIPRKESKTWNRPVNCMHERDRERRQKESKMWYFLNRALQNYFKTNQIFCYLWLINVLFVDVLHMQWHLHITPNVLVCNLTTSWLRSQRSHKVSPYYASWILMSSDWNLPWR